MCAGPLPRVAEVVRLLRSRIDGSDAAKENHVAALRVVNHARLVSRGRVVRERRNGNERRDNDKEEITFHRKALNRRELLPVRTPLIRRKFRLGGYFTTETQRTLRSLCDLCASVVMTS